MKWGLRKLAVGIAVSFAFLSINPASANTSSKQRNRQLQKSSEVAQRPIQLPAPVLNPVLDPYQNSSFGSGQQVTQDLGDQAFPKAPDAVLTPGELCSQPESYRYAERIPYCGRHVDPETKADIISDYDRERGFKIEQMNRSKFKIDHFIPLCMGGANNRDNLWPQHESVYTITDSIEELSCAKMAEGKLLQAQAVQIIKTVKYDLSKADSITAYLNSL